MREHLSRTVTRARALWPLGVLFCLGLPANAACKDIYVATTGMDDRMCGAAAASACKTIAYAVDRATSGDTVIVTQGTYTESAIGIDKNLTIRGQTVRGATVQAASAPGLACAPVFVIGKNATVTVSLAFLRIQYGRATHGGGILVNSSSSLTVDRCQILENEATDGEGGGIALGKWASLTLKNSTVADNAAPVGSGVSGFGGGIFGWCDTTLTIIDSTIDNNTAGSGGGGIYSVGPLVIEGSTVSHNTATATGGGIYASDTVQIKKSLITSNDGGWRGGGLRADVGTAGTTVLLEDTIVSDNYAAAEGGGIHLGEVETATTVRRCAILRNVAGGGAALYGGSGAIVNSTFSGNYGEFGVAIHGDNYSNTWTWDVSFSTFLRNESWHCTGLGGDFLRKATFNIKNSIVANRVIRCTACIVDHNCDSSAATIVKASGVNFSNDSTCSGLTKVSDSSLNLMSGLVQDAASGTYTHPPITGSVAIDAATDCLDVDGNTISTDQRGVSRPEPVGGNCDVGAYEGYLSFTWIPIS